MKSLANLMADSSLRQGPPARRELASDAPSSSAEGPMRRSPYSHRAPAPLSLRARVATLKDVRFPFQSFRRTRDPVLPALHAREATRRIDDERANQMAPPRTGSAHPHLRKLLSTLPL